MNNEQLLQNVINAFDKNDAASILTLLSDDVEWIMVGDRTITGKDAMAKWFADNQEMKMLSSTKDHVIINDEQAAVDGWVQCKGKNGELMEMFYCDVYEFDNGKVRKMISYVIEKKNKVE